MRFAICLSGQPRFFKECYFSIYKNIIKPNNADVFIHTWSYENEPDEPYKYGGNGGWKKQRIEKDAHRQVVELYKPLDYLIEPTKQFKMPCQALVKTFQTFKSDIPNEAKEASLSIEQYAQKIFGDQHSMWYGIMLSNMLANLHAMKNGFTYDMVVRSRFDVNIDNKLDLSSFNKQFLYYEEMGQPGGLVSDWINFSSQENMALYGSTFNTIKKTAIDYVNNAQIQSLPFCSELISAINLSRNNIAVAGIKMGLSLPRM